MRIFDERHRLFGLVNLLDLVIAAVVVVVALAAYMLFFSESGIGRGAPDDLIAIEYVLVCRSVADFDESWITKGDLVSRKGSRSIGVVESVEVEQALRETVNSEGETVVSESPMTWDIYITVSSEAEETPQGYVVDGDLALRNNLNVEIATPGFISASRVVSIRSAD